MKIITLILVTTVFTITTFASDILTLNNQMMFEGKILKIKNCNVTFKASDRNKYIIPADDIFSIKFENLMDKIYTDYLNLADNDPDKCMKGQLDADNYHGKAGLHVALGVLFGPFAVIGAAVSNPTPEKGNNTYIMSHNKDFFRDPFYLNCYTKKARGKNVSNTAIGWGAWILFLIAMGGV